MSQLTVVARIAAKPGSVEAVKAELLKLIEPTRKEQGCIAYTLHQDNENPAIFIFCETWENAACLERHAASEHIGSYISAAGDLLAERVIHKLTRLA